MSLSGSVDSQDLFGEGNSRFVLPPSTVTFQQSNDSDSTPSCSSTVSVDELGISPYTLAFMVDGGVTEALLKDQQSSAARGQVPDRVLITRKHCADPADQSAFDGWVREIKSILEVAAKDYRVETLKMSHESYSSVVEKVEKYLSKTERVMGFLDTHSLTINFAFDRKDEQLVKEYVNIVEDKVCNLITDADIIIEAFRKKLESLGTQMEIGVREVRLKGLREDVIATQLHIHQLLRSNGVQKKLADGATLRLLAKPAARLAVDRALEAALFRCWWAVQEQCIVVVASKGLLESCHSEIRKCVKTKMFGVPQDKHAKFIQKKSEDILKSLACVATVDSTKTELVFTKGRLEDQQVDVLVNSLGRELDLAVGANTVTKALAGAAGPVIQAELAELATEKTPDFGTVLDTRAGNLPCKRIYHVILEKFSKPEQDQRVQMLKKATRLCVEKAAEGQLSSIALPALCTGVLQYPAGLVARAMLEEISDYIAAVRQTSLTQIKVVFLPTDQGILETFNKERQSRLKPDEVLAHASCLHLCKWSLQLKAVSAEQLDKATKEIILACTGVRR